MSNSVLRRGRSLLPEAFGVAGRDLDDLFDRLFTPNTNGSASQWVAPLAIWEQGDQFHLEVELPGVSDENVDVTFEKGHLKIAVVLEKSKDENRKYLHDERTYGSMTRVISVPDTVDHESITADLKTGILHVQLTKRPELMPKKIEIKTE
ncbi:MAG: Hsp20/alpha crystallin family protein [Planctomycetales bacterium]|nr:Hsp20/alpha crystallin family protein [Planctomycetales bacterium]